MSEQFYLISIKRMSKCDEADVVPEVLLLVPESELTNTKLLPAVAEACAGVLKGFPGTDLRPMTHEEAQAWRAEGTDEVYKLA
jgi:hypothetical protein